MKLLTIDNNSIQKLGVKVIEGVVDVEKALTTHPTKGVSSDLMELIEGGKEAIQNLKNFIETLPKTGDYMLNENDIEWGPAITSPEKIICVGLNYKKHADETNSPYPETPILFTKYNNTLTGNKKEIVIPNVTHKLDYEVELGIVIGAKVKNVSKENALDYVFGYVTANDLSARDLQNVTSQWLLGKSCDGFAPVGPFLVTSDEVSDPNNLNLKTVVNGEDRQNSNTSDMIFSCEEIISFISQHMTLKPGDLILTGTPEGVVLGFPEEDQVYLQPGDKVTVEVQQLGSLMNQFIEETN